MYVVSKEIMTIIMSEAQKDQQHQMLLSHCRELEEAYSRVMTGLSGEDREVIDGYFTACCQMQLDLLRVAYRCGTRGGFLIYPKY